MQVDEFLEFAKTKMKIEIYKEAKQLTKQQSECAIWHELRYGRMTASKFYEAAHYKTGSGSFVQQVIVASKVLETSAMARGKALGKDVMKVLKKELGILISRPRMYLAPSHPTFATSPDGLTGYAIFEVK